MIDLRSDTVTQPTEGMRQAIFTAEVGDDVFGEDPTVNLLQQKISELTAKEAAMFVASGTMGNQICIKTHTDPGNEIILERNSHIYNYECGAPSFLSGVQIMPVTGQRGSFTLDQIRDLVRPENVHHPVTRLIVVENTHNRGGGAIFPFEEIKKIREFATEHRIRMHLDGARLWNASKATGISIKNYCDLFDSVSLCFSKGLGAPAGSIIAASETFIHQARYYRKLFGGGMRQAGILAAGALYAVNHHFDRLSEDHKNARKLAEFLAKIPGIDIDLESVQTNIVIFDVKKSGLNGQDVVQRLSDSGVKMLTFAGTKIRAVTHLHISESDIKITIDALADIFNKN